MPSTSELRQLFEYNFPLYRDIFDRFTDIYNENPVAFADVFFDVLPQMDPKSVRVICYELFSHGISMDQVYAQRSNSQPAPFLSSLDTFSLESMMTLLKYGFPAYPHGDIFFLSSLPKYYIILDSALPTRLDWLSFLLDVCTHLGIDLNVNNASTGETCLIWAIKYGSFSLVLDLLYHRVDPNRVSLEGQSPLSVALDLFNFPDIDTTYKTYLNIIRQLRVYGAVVDETIKQALVQNSYRPQIEHALYLGSSLEPIYSSGRPVYFSCDQIEDLAVLAELDPTLVQNEKVYQSAVDKQRDKTISTNLGLMSWPYFISELIDSKCDLTVDYRPVAESPPNPDIVYRTALETLKDVADGQTPEIIDLPTETPAALQGVAPTEYGISVPVLPLASGPLVPTDQNFLPSL